MCSLRTRRSINGVGRKRIRARRTRSSPSPTVTIQSVSFEQSSRRRFGAQRWNLYHDALDPTLYVETYTANSWQEHMRQHQERTTRSDQTYVEEARRLTKEGTTPKVDHLLFAYDE